MTRKKARPSIPITDPVVVLIAQRTAALTAKYAPMRIKPKPSRLSKKGKALQALIDAGQFGCHSEQVAKAFSILTGENIQNKRETPMIDRDDAMLPGNCFKRVKGVESTDFYSSELNAKMPLGVPFMCLTRDTFLRLDTGGQHNLERALRHAPVDAVDFPNAEEIANALSTLPAEKFKVLGTVLL